MIAEPIAKPIANRKIWTYDEVSEIDDDVQRELHAGEIYPMPSPTLNHQSLILRLAILLTKWARAHGGKAYLSPVDLYVSPTEYYIPDLVFYSAAQMQSGEVERDPKRLTLAPQLIIEILSPSTARNDRTLKTRAYANFGIEHYWIIDPRAQTLEAFELSDGRYFVAGSIAESEVYAPAAFPNLQISGAELFESAPESESQIESQ